jgi:predicted TIM-barrel fold metal-dependent hydrolase
MALATFEPLVDWGTHRLEIPVFDADNHFYETPEALTKYLPEKYRGAIRFVEVDGRARIALRGQITEYIPNPTFEVVAAPGSHIDFYRGENPEGRTLREMAGRPIRSIDAFRDPADRLALLDRQGLSRAMMFPTLANLVEQRLTDDPELTHASVHALNEWMHEHWSFDYQSRIFPAPVITLPLVDKAIEELEWVLARGAKVVLIRPAPVRGWKGFRSFALPEFDPFWARVQEAGIPVVVHSTDSFLQSYVDQWEPRDSEQFFGFSPFRWAAQGHRDIEDTLTSLVCHGTLTRFPGLRFASIENGAGWLPVLVHTLERLYRQMPQEFAEHPVDALKRALFINPFWEDDIREVIDLVGPDRVLFGSDYPHAEGLAEPRSYLQELDGLPDDVIRKVMGENAASLLHLPGVVA